MTTNEYRVLGYAPDDSRFYITRHTDTRYPITRFASREEVDRRREELKFNLRMAAGLYPWPAQTPLNVKREDVGVYDGYSIQKVMFESYPGMWSTGNLYFPHPMPSKAPAILNLIGHWWPQRLTREPTADYPQQLANFAKMGFICLATDMIGTVDSRQVSHDYGKGEKELWLSNGLGIQLWNNIRAMDLLCSMPEVDAANIGVTGASGGGSQTLFLSLLDDRVKAAAPINMISLHMQGGCQCENAPGLRRHTDNVEMCAMLAPRPLFLAGSDGDWTKYLETAELPGVLESYRQYDAEHMVEYFYQIAPHQYNEKTRHHVYNFFARHLMGQDIVWHEQPIEVEDLQAMTWFRGNGHAPGYANNDEYFAAHKKELYERISSLSMEERRKMLAWMTDVRENHARVVHISSHKSGSLTVEKSLILGDYGEKIPVVKLIPAKSDGNKICLALSGEGKACVDREEIRKMLAEGMTVVSGDLFQTGESADCKQVLSLNGNHVSDPILPYHTTFNNTAEAFRIQDICLLATMVSGPDCELTIWAEGDAARAATCAAALLDCVEKVIIETAPLNLESDQDYYENFFVPGICALGGLKGCLAMIRGKVQLF